MSRIVINKNSIMIALISILTALMLQVLEPIQSVAVVYDNPMIILTADDDDQYLGEVNLCDDNGIKCELGKAYKDSDNGRVYVIVFERYGWNYKNELYAQKSNKSGWEYMIRYENGWLYFSF